MADRYFHYRTILQTSAVWYNENDVIKISYSVYGWRVCITSLECGKCLYLSIFLPQCFHYSGIKHTESLLSTWHRAREILDPVLIKLIFQWGNVKRRDDDKGHESDKCRIMREELGEFALYKVASSATHLLRKDPASPGHDLGAQGECWESSLYIR